MKKTFRTVALALVLGTTVTGCQKEYVDYIPEEITTCQPISVVYLIDGISYVATFNDEMEWKAFLDRLFFMAQEGHTVVFSNQSRTTDVVGAKEKVTYTTRSESDAKSWADAMRKEGYVVTIIFDTNAGVYTCTAIR